MIEKVWKIVLDISLRKWLFFGITKIINKYLLFELVRQDYPIYYYLTCRKILSVCYIENISLLFNFTCIILNFILFIYIQIFILSKNSNLNNRIVCQTVTFLDMIIGKSSISIILVHSKFHILQLEEMQFFSLN